MLHDQSTFDEIDEDIYNENKVGKKKEGRDTFETEESETAASSSSEAIEEYYVADNIKLKKPPPGSKIEALRDTIEQRVGMERMRIIINLKSSTYKSALFSTKFSVSSFCRPSSLHSLPRSLHFNSFCEG